MRTNTKKQSDHFDIAAPIAELLDFLIKILAKGLDMLLKFLYKKYFQKNPPLEKIEMKALNCKKKTENPEALGIDCSNKKEVLLKDISFARHSFIVGASGFGKTNLISLLQENALKLGRPIIFIDPKGDLEAMTTFKNLCEKNKKTCYIFSEFYDKSIKLNPVLEGTINQVADRIISAFEWSEEFYKNYSYKMLFQVLRELKNQNEEFTLRKIHDKLETEHKSKEIVGLLVKLETIIESDFGPYLEATSIDYTLSKIRKEKACLYIGLSTQGYGETAMSIGKLFLGELLYNSYYTLRGPQGESEGLKNPISVYFDEFGAVVTPQFIELLNKCRGAGIELTMAVQTPCDIDRVNESLTSQIIENSGNIFVMKQRLEDAASFFSNAIGTTIEKKETFATEDGEYSGRGTMRESHVNLVHANLIKNLRVGQCFLLRHDPTKINLINIRQRKTEFKKEEKEKLNQCKAL